MKHKPPIMEVVQESSQLQKEEFRLTQIRNEKNRLEREIDILKVRYENQQRSLQDQLKTYQEQWRVDRDKIDRQLYDNKIKEDRLIKTQSEVNQLRAQIETDLTKQKNLLLKKEVELDEQLSKAKEERADLARRLSAKGD